METTNLIERLYQHHEDYGQGHAQNLFQVCLDCKEAAEKIQKLQRFIDDMLGDHYVDYLEFYINRCEKLEKELSIQRMLVLNGESAIETNKILTQRIAKLILERDEAIEDIKKAIVSDDICVYCKNHHDCEEKDCGEYFDGQGVTDKDGEEFDWKWSCEDFNWGECPKLRNTPCNGCMQNDFSGFEWHGLREEN